ncbi:TyrKc [Nesidiocoris tenuis]|uniref:TyrKc n=1 Tax=Nesidiocoris tenuis TaxID=355587 RepID=A0ABN7A7U3_9HEMI|nr:TyrKc [Nesidiocoris tenuis]
MESETLQDRIRKGTCKPETCAPEAACTPYGNDTYTCVCPHDLSPPTKDLKCRRNVVPPSLSPIDIIPLNSANSSVLPSVPPPYFVSGILHARPELVPILSGVLGLILLITCGMIWAYCSRSTAKRGRRNNRRRKGHFTMPVGLSKGVLHEDKYAANPQYVVSLPELQSPDSVHLPQLPREVVKFEHVIGEGCFGKVFKGKLRVEGKEEKTVAIKVLKETATPEAEDDFMREVEIMASFQHPNILSLLGFVARDQSKSPCMVFEFMPHGDLTDVLRGNSGTLWKNEKIFPRLSKDSLLSIAIQIARGMQYLAEQHFVHRDLACRNCLVGDNLSVKIADFGMSRDVYTCDYYKIGGSRLMPVRWMSPESISYGRFTLESDVWSYGIVLWEIYSLGKQPYFGHSNEEVVKLILQGIMLIPPEETPQTICEVMRQCWRTEPKDRTDFNEIHEQLVRLSSQEMTNNLPRPPPFIMTTSIPELPELEVEYYLKPQPVSPPHEYLQPLPD